jgi:lipid A 3-O-deacylase
MRHRTGLFLFCTSVFLFYRAGAQTNVTLWADQPGDGFSPNAQSLSLQMGASHGIHIFGGNSRHDLAIASLTYGHMLGSKIGGNHWYSGNFEIRGELFSGGQFEPSKDWLVGASPHLRYNFATGTRLVPYVDAGAGVTATSIGPPDLGGTFELNLQAATGVLWFVKDDIALSLEARFLHLSSAGIEHPNLGVNTVFGMLGVSWFF